MKLGPGIVTAIATLTVLCGGADAVITVEGSQLEKHRAHNAKQRGDYIWCVSKAINRCEKEGDHTGPECNLADPPASTIADAKAKDEFIEAIAQCISKLDFTKYGPASDYFLLGCPDDSDLGTPGDQPFADYIDGQAGYPGTVAAQFGSVVTLLQLLCGGLPVTTDSTVRECQTKTGRLNVKYLKSAVKCQYKCENDHHNRIGNGGETDSPTICNVGGICSVAGNACVEDAGCPLGETCNALSTDANFKACVDKARARAERRPRPEGLTLSELRLFMALGGALMNDRINDGFNEDDCPPPP